MSKNIKYLKEQSEDVWNKVYKLYPNIEEVLNTLHKKQLEVYDLLEELDSKYPVEGYVWECDLNEVSQEAVNPFYLQPIDVNKAINDNWRESLDKQLICVSGVHHFEKIEHGIEWCKYCGTLKKSRYTEDFINIGIDMLYPESPHFLPKKEE